MTDCLIRIGFLWNVQPVQFFTPVYLCRPIVCSKISQWRLTIQRRGVASATSELFGALAWCWKFKRFSHIWWILDRSTNFVSTGWNSNGLIMRCSSRQWTTGWGSNMRVTHWMVNIRVTRWSTNKQTPSCSIWRSCCSIPVPWIAEASLTYFISK